MKTKIVQILAAVVLVLTVDGIADAQPLDGRYGIELSLGAAVRLGSTADVNYSGVDVDVDAAGFLGGLGFNYWMSESSALTVQFAARTVNIGVSTGVSGVNTSTSSVTTALLGLKYYLPPSTYDRRGRPFLSIAAGPVIGKEERTEIYQTVLYESATHGAFGGRFGAGYDLQLGRHTMLGFSTGYLFMSDFEEPVGARVNHSGPDFAISFSYLFGDNRL